MKGIILAGGAGTRLYPLTTVTSKQLLGVYDKPMIYYPLSTLMMAGIQDILIISTPEDLDKYRVLLGDGSRFGLQLEYCEQPRPEGLAQAFILGRDFIGEDSCAMVLGDNIFNGPDLRENLLEAAGRAEKGRATVFGYKVSDPERFGVVSFKGDPDMSEESTKFMEVDAIEEKPKNPRSSYAVTGLYFYPAGVSKRAEKLEFSDRHELEITDLTNTYLREGTLDVQILKKGYKWLDAGTIESLYAASEYVRSEQLATGKLVASPEETAFCNGWISRGTVKKTAEDFGHSSYGEALRKLVQE